MFLDKLRNKLTELIRGKKDMPKIQWSLYGRVWREIGRPQWKWLAAGVVATILAAGAEGYSVTLVQQVVDKTFIDKNMAAVYWIGIQVVIAFGLKGIFTFSKDLLMCKGGLVGSEILQDKIYRHMVRQDISKVFGDGIGKNLNYFNVQAGSVLNLVTGTLIGLVQNIATLTVTFALMLYYGSRMCLVLLILVPAILLPMLVIMRRQRELARRSFGIANTISQQLNQTLHGIKTIQSFANEEVESRRFRTVLHQSMTNSYKNTQARALRSPLMEFFISIGLCFAMIMGGHFIASGSMTTGDFTAFLLALTAAYKPAKNITNTGDSVQHGLLAAATLFNFLDTPPSIKNRPNAKELTGNKLAVKFNDVSFEYRKGEPILQNIDLDVPAGKVCALVGPSGGGKTTMLNLLERFYEPQSGNIEINGTDIRDFTLESLRHNISEVSQDVFLFNGTIEENIKYGAPHATHDQVVAAARAANAHDFIMSFPKKYNAIVGERGALLSGGQKQRIAIARAILKDSPILLLDEATSALDTESERLIQQALGQLMQGRTTFVIAHRLSTILDADLICVVKDGHIVERGTDAELCELHGEYKKLRDIQFKTQE